MLTATRPRCTAYGSSRGSGAYSASSPASSGPQPSPPMLAAVATSVARDPPPGGASSMTYAVAAPVKRLTDRPERSRPAYNQPTASARRKHTALAAANPRPQSSVGRLPTVSEALPARSSTPMTPKAYTAYTTVTVSSENPNFSW